MSIWAYKGQTGLLYVLICRSCWLSLQLLSADLRWSYKVKLLREGASC